MLCSRRRRLSTTSASPVSSELNAQSNLNVDFEVDPLFGGGRTSLSGLNLGYRLGRNQTLSSTWLLLSSLASIKLSESGGGCERIDPTLSAPSRGARSGASNIREMS